MQHIDLRAELDKAQCEIEQQKLVDHANRILTTDYKMEEAIARRMKRYSVMSVMFDQSILQKEPIYDLKTIEAICVRYRMRFLPSHLFAGEVPKEAISVVRRLEKDYSMTLVRFKIVAPSSKFILKDSQEDPVLLAELPNKKYVFVYQWGNKMSWYQRLLKYPYRHIGALTMSAGAIGLVLAALLPISADSIKLEIIYRFFAFSVSTGLIMIVSIIGAIMRAKDFSENVWNSKFV